MMPALPCTARLTPTTDMSRLAGKTVYAAVDYQNLGACVRQVEAKLDYRALAQAFRTSAEAVELCSVLAVPSTNDRRLQALESAGFATRFFLINEKIRWPNQVKGTNADLDVMSAFAESLLTARRHDAYVVGSGDGDLVLGVARLLRRSLPDCMIATLSVKGCTSQRILARNAAGLINANFYIGSDVTCPRNSTAASGNARHQEGLNNASRS